MRVGWIPSGLSRPEVRVARNANRAKAFWKPCTVLPGRRRLGRQTTQNARAVSNRSACESPQHQVISNNTNTNGWVLQWLERCDPRAF